MFRRFRQRRAMRSMEKKNKHIPPNESTKKSTSSSSTSAAVRQANSSTIFRSIDSTTTFIPSIQTTGTSFSLDSDDGQQPTPTSTTNLNISCTSFAKGILLGNHIDEDIVNQNTEERQPSINHGSKTIVTTKKSSPKNNLRSVLDDIHNEIFVSEEMKQQLFNTQMELAFFKESYTEIQKELHCTQAMVQRHQLELTIGRMAMTYTEMELETTKASFQESVVSLVDMKLLLLSLQEQLTARTDELSALMNASIPTDDDVHDHRSSAQIIFDFLSAGSYLSTTNSTGEDE